MKTKNNSRKFAKFVVPTLAAAGSAALNADTDAMKNTSVEADEASLLQNAKSLVSELEAQQAYTLAQHSSHGSHGSHSSHSSHASGGARTISIDNDGVDELQARNLASTPNSSVLPSSPALVEQRKLKILPGNSAKFADTVIQAQLALAGRGFDVGAIDGSLHARSIAAIYEFQSSVGLQSTGKLSPETLSSLGIVAE